MGEKLDVGFRPKDREEGSIPLPDFLLTLLRERRARYAHMRMIFELPGGKTQDHFLRTTKRLALRAGLNCGNCYSKSGKCCAMHPVCRRIILHKLPKTYATMHHESGVSALAQALRPGHNAAPSPFCARIRRALLSAVCMQ